MANNYSPDEAPAETEGVLLDYVSLHPGYVLAIGERFLPESTLSSPKGSK